jgi:protein-disulfide isomerase
MNPSVLLLLLRLLSLSALFFSSATAVDYFQDMPTFCTQGGGCDIVRHSGIGQTIGKILPILGLGCYGSIFYMSFSSNPAVRRLAGRLSFLAGMGALGFIIIQAVVIHAFCWLCMGVDTSGVLAAVVGLLVVKQGTLSAAKGSDEPVSSTKSDLSASPNPLTLYLPRLSWIGIAFLVVVFPLAWSKAKPPPKVPAYVQSLWQPGKVNVIEFSDFTCPYCRALHPVLKSVVEKSGNDVHFVRKCFPIPSHENSKEAAQAYYCAVKQNKGEEMADFLFTEEDHSVGNCKKLAQKLKLDMQQYQTCVTDPATNKSIEQTMDQIRKADFKGLPSVWINDTVSLGFLPAWGEEKYAKAIQHARSTPVTSSSSSLLRSLVSWQMIGLFVIGLGMIAVGFYQRAKDSPSLATREHLLLCSHLPGCFCSVVCLVGCSCGNVAFPHGMAADGRHTPPGTTGAFRFEAGCQVAAPPCAHLSGCSRRVEVSGRMFPW